MQSSIGATTDISDRSLTTLHQPRHLHGACVHCDFEHGKQIELVALFVHSSCFKTSQAHGELSVALWTCNAEFQASNPKSRCIQQGVLVLERIRPRATVDVQPGRDELLHLIRTACSLLRSIGPDRVDLHDDRAGIQSHEVVPGDLYVTDPKSGEVEARRRQSNDEGCSSWAHREIPKPEAPLQEYVSFDLSRGQKIWHEDCQLPGEQTVDNSSFAVHHDSPSCGRCTANKAGPVVPHNATAITPAIDPVHHNRPGRREPRCHLVIYVIVSRRDGR
mmetsp:Transcript_46403/g.83783  ORF Transcript_46403/g.83783 Transcript_46403/m.83783 type:complete len:276 (+) Transcript_46403:343-1170(+)